MPYTVKHGKGGDVPVRKDPSSTPTVLVRKKRLTSSPATTSPHSAPQKTQVPPPQSKAPAAPVKKPPSKTSPSTVPPPQARTRTQPTARQRRIQDLLVVFRERWPHLFPADVRQVKPLALGIHTALSAALPDAKPYLIRSALNLYQRRSQGAYWRAIVRGGPRYTLDGTPVGAVTARDQDYAREQLAAMTTREKAKRGGRPRVTAPHEEVVPAPAAADGDS